MRSKPHPTLLVVLLAFVSLVGYALRTNISIAQEYMAPELGLSFAQMGTISAAFQLAYALFQIPTGFLGDRFGARIVLTIAILGWAATSLLTGIVPASAGVATAFASLLLFRVLLGVSQAATYPVGSMAITHTLPERLRGTANGIYISAATIGSGLAPLTLAPLMVALGWRSVFLASSAVGLVAAITWYLAAKDAGPTAQQSPPLREQLTAALALLKHRDIMLVSLSYAMQAAVFFVFIFWFFRYLTDGRHFTVLASGIWGSLPSFTAALLGPFGGVLADRLGVRMGFPRSRRLAAMSGLILAGLLVALGASFANPYFAIAALSLSVACVNSCEGPFWATVTSLGRANPGAAGGVLNFMGNLGGVVSIWAVPRMYQAWGWTATLGVWAAVAIVAALLWLFVRMDQADEPEPAPVKTQPVRAAA
jgi:ACS family glucarate transporter-like MFS transporter